MKDLDSIIISNNAKYLNYYIQATVHRRNQIYSLALNYSNLALDVIKKEEIIDTSRLSDTYSLKVNIEYEFSRF